MNKAKLDLSHYKALVFDCDGVILDSNQIKTEGFYEVASRYGEGAAKMLVDYHVQNGGVSRFEKFHFFVKNILCVPVSHELITELLSSYSEFVFSKLLKCKIAHGLEDLREETRDLKWMVVSGGMKTELQRVFLLRHLTTLFDGGIFGSPENKEQILRSLVRKKNFLPALYIGDSRYDHVASTEANLDFIFASGWTEFSRWKDYCKIHRIKTIAHLSDLISIQKKGFVDESYSN